MINQLKWNLPSLINIHKLIYEKFRKEITFMFLYAIFCISDLVSVVVLTNLKDSREQ